MKFNIVRSETGLIYQWVMVSLYHELTEVNILGYWIPTKMSVSNVITSKPEGYGSDA